MSITPLFSPVAASTPYDQKITRLNTTQVQETIDKLAWLMTMCDSLDEEGNFVFRLGPPLDKIFLSSDFVGYSYFVSASNNGELVTDSSVRLTAMPQNYRVFKKPDGTFVRLSVADDGTVAVNDVEEDPYTSEQVSKKLFLKSPNNTIWLFGITNLNEVVLESGYTYNNWFKIVNQDDQLLFGVNTQGFLGLSHLAVFTKSTLPLQPDQQPNTLPWCFLLDDDGITKVPVYFDGVVWRYFSNNAIVKDKDNA